MSRTKKKNVEKKQQKLKKKSKKAKKLSFFPPQNKKKKTSKTSKEDSIIVVNNVGHDQRNLLTGQKDEKSSYVPMLSNTLSKQNKKFLKKNSLRERMIHKLKSAHFRYLNEELYSLKSTESLKLFQSDPKAFKIYHEGYKQQVAQWPLNPLDKIIEYIKKQAKDFVIADFGCGEGKLAESVPHQVHSFDLVAVNSNIIAGDMSNTHLECDSVNIAVFCLSLMSTNINDCLKEANRVLQKKGILKIVEVESRFDDVNNFIRAVKKFGFSLISKDFSHSLFYFFDFQKEYNTKYSKNLPTVSLLPCVYKKR